jgi:hypothetical protein
MLGPFDCRPNVVDFHPLYPHRNERNDHGKQRHAQGKKEAEAAEGEAKGVGIGQLGRNASVEVTEGRTGERGTVREAGGDVSSTRLSDFHSLLLGRDVARLPSIPAAGSPLRAASLFR